MKSVLAAAGYELKEQTGVWQRADYAGINYSDGDQVERRIESIVSEAQDISVLSPELAKHCTDWTSRYHLSPTRANILRPFESLFSGDVLEVGAGCGAITRYLGECGGNVLALEGSPRRAAIARARTRDLENIAVISENFDVFRCDNRFDVVVLIGVFEYASMFMSGDRPASRMLEHARSFLKPGGKLIIAIENQLGLKYFAGAPEDHISLPMYGIEGRYQPGQPQTYGRKALSGLLTDAGFGSIEFLAPFPDYKLPTSIVSEWGFADPDFDAGALAWQSVWHDVQLPDFLAFSPTLVWPALTQNGLGLDFANSFLVVASDDHQPTIPRSHLAWHFSSSRKPRFCKSSTFVKSSEGYIEVRYLPLSPIPNGNGDPGFLTQRFPPRATYIKGECLSWQLTKILSQERWKIADVVLFVEHYLNCLRHIAALQGASLDVTHAESAVPGFLFDCIPQNLIATAAGEIVFIDQEWSVASPLELGYLLTRALFPALHGAANYETGPDSFDGSRLSLFLAVTANLGWSISKDKMYEYAELETQILEEAIPNPTSLDTYLAWLDSPIKIRSNFHELLLQRNAAIADLRARDQNIANLTQLITERENQLGQQRSHFSKKLTENDREIADLSQQVAAYENQLSQMANSRSWKLTQPLRNIVAGLRAGRHLVRVAVNEVAHFGIQKTTRKFLYLTRRDGVFTLCRRVFGVVRSNVQGPSAGHPADQDKSSNPLSIVPYYIDPLLDSTEPASGGEYSIAVHVHLFYIDMMKDICDRLANIRRPFDLYVSVGRDTDCSNIERQLRSLAPCAKKVVVERVPNRGRDISPLIVQFGRRLARYDIVGHFHTKKSAHNPNLRTWCIDVLNLLLGEPGSRGGHVAHIFEKLRANSKVIYPEGRREILQDRTRWAENRDIAQTILKRYTKWSVDDFPAIDFPEGSMFWARGECLRGLLLLPVTFNDFPEEPIPADGTLAHALERLILIFAASYPGQNLRLHRRDSIADYRFYEPQEDFSNTVVHSDIKVLSFYLPQFHPIPENDAWHGKGFTEWVKVRAASPLFEGHYQQHIPHTDIGYYLLDSADTLRKQAELMRKAGVSGQVFYHYWFGGKLILEHPAQMLLSTPDIQMPFCFCWANENWTRRWDGNDAEVLLAQSYSENDAREFIRYLIPFFADERYIRVDGRPVLFVYRPSSIPDIQTYLRVWGEECRAQGMQAPYVVAVLTRGAKSPVDFGMDAGVERVLHDWTLGAVPDIRESLTKYTAMNGSALSYPEVAAFYSSQTDTKDFTYFRSIVPMWDNTARYGTEAFLLHGSTPEVFQRWFENLITYSKANVPEDRRFILVNAWNEWAEGAHLEPDSRYGYSYLNSVGRALSDVPYSRQFNAPSAVRRMLRVHLEVPTYFCALLSADPAFARRFSQVVRRSSIFEMHHVTINEAGAQHIEGIRTGSRLDADYIVEFRRPTFFAGEVLGQLVRYADCKPESTVIPNFYGDDALLEVSTNGSVHSHDAYSAPVVVYSAKMTSDSWKNFRMCADARCFLTHPHSLAESELPVVTTVIRYHKSGDLNLLSHALGCLVSMRNCICVPLIATQDLSSELIDKLSALLVDFPWYENHRPIVHHYQSEKGTGDLRSKMLNESLRQVRTRFAAFLDYDDLLMPHAYEWLINRLIKTGKAVAFGRVYSTAYSFSASQLLERKRTYEYGYSYEEFFENNHAPLHSFLLDLHKLDVGNLLYFDDQRYLEDYLLTLQLFSEQNCDWESLRFNRYIGDYIHSTDRSHTLAFTEDSDRENLLHNVEFLLCENRIQDMRALIVETERGYSVEPQRVLASNT
jgi:lipopolysaccharide biosynthesis protein/SAM-dependent methyltransferase